MYVELVVEFDPMRRMRPCLVLLNWQGQIHCWKLHGVVTCTQTCCHQQIRIAFINSGFSSNIPLIHMENDSEFISYVYISGQTMSAFFRKLLNPEDLPGDLTFVPPWCSTTRLRWAPLSNRHWWPAHHHPTISPCHGSVTWKFKLSGLHQESYIIPPNMSHHTTYIDVK